LQFHNLLIDFFLIPAALNTSFHSFGMLFTEKPLFSSNAISAGIGAFYYSFLTF